MAEYDRDYGIEEVFMRMTAAADYMRKELCEYGDNKNEDGDGMFFTLTDDEKEAVEEGIYVEPGDVKDPAVHKEDREDFNAFGERLSEEEEEYKKGLEEKGLDEEAVADALDVYREVRDETVEEYEELSHSQLEEPQHEPLKQLGGTYFSENGVPADLRDKDLPWHLKYTFNENDGSGIGGTNGVSDETYLFPQLLFEGDSLGAKDSVGRGLGENPVYKENGEELDIYVLMVSETDGKMKLGTPETEGLITYTVNQALDTDDWGQLLPYEDPVEAVGEPVDGDENELRTWMEEMMPDADLQPKEEVKTEKETAGVGEQSLIDTA